MIRIILVTGLAIGSATGGAVALAVAHDGLFDGRDALHTRAPLTAMELPAPALPATSGPALPVSVATALDRTPSDAGVGAAEVGLVIMPDADPPQREATKLTLSTSDDAGAASGAATRLTGAESATEGAVPTLLEPSRQTLGWDVQDDRQTMRSVDFSPVSTGVYR